MFTAVKIHVEVFWFVTPQSEDGGSKLLRNVGIIPQHYTESQRRRPLLEWNVFFRKETMDLILQRSM